MQKICHVYDSTVTRKKAARVDAGVFRETV